MKKNLLILALFLAIVGCDQTKNNWIKAKQTNSVTEVKKFLQENPNSEFDMAAKNLLDSLEWINTQSTNSIESYKQFIGSYPKSKYENIALKCIDSLAWFIALNSGDSAIMLKYLKSMDIQNVNSLKIRANGSSLANGHYTGCVKLPNGGLAFFGGGPVEIIIFKDLIGWPKEEIEKKKLKTGHAQIWVNGSLIASKPIDIKKTEKDYCKVFGVPFEKIY